MQQTTTTEVCLDERKAARFRASVQSTGGVRVPAAHAVRDVPLPKTPEGAIMAHNPTGIRGMSVQTLKAILAKLRPEPIQEPRPPPKHYEPPFKGRYRRRDR
jgi:hypothetical protein